MELEAHRGHLVPRKYSTLEFTSTLECTSILKFHSGMHFHSESILLICHLALIQHEKMA